MTFAEPKNVPIQFPKAYQHYGTSDGNKLIVLFVSSDRGIVLKNGLAPFKGGDVETWDPLGTLHSKDEPVWLPIDVTISH